MHFFGRLSFLVDENAHAVHFFIAALLQLLDRCQPSSALNGDGLIFGVVYLYWVSCVSGVMHMPFVRSKSKLSLCDAPICSSLLTEQADHLHAKICPLDIVGNAGLDHCTASWLGLCYGC